MASNLKISPTMANASMGDGAHNGVAPLFNSGTIKIYDGAQPADPTVAVTTQTLLATLTFGATAFGAASAGVITANAITSGTAVATSTATWFRTAESGGTALMDGNVGTSGTDMVLGTTSIVTGAVVSISSFTITQPNP